MSQTAQTAPAVKPATEDEYLMAQAAPEQPPGCMVLDLKYFNVRLVTPVGRFRYISVAAPHAIPQQGNAPAGKPKYTATLWMNERSCGDVWKAICMVANAKWPVTQRPDPQNPSQMLNLTGEQLLFIHPSQGGLHCPLRLGESQYLRDPSKYAEWRGIYFINCSMEPMTRSGQPQKPVCLNEMGEPCDPAKFYPGCYGRMNITVAAFEQSGNKGIGIYLNAVQFAEYGDRLGAFDAVGQAKNAFAAAGALPPAKPRPGGEFGPHAMPPGSAPGSMPGGAVAAFAAPPSGMVAPAAMPQAGGSTMTSMAPTAPVAPGFRPPGV